MMMNHDNTRAKLAIALGVLLLGGFLAFIMIAPAEVSTNVATEGAITVAESSDSGFPFWIFIALVPAILTPLIAVKLQKQDDEKPKNQPEDPLFEKPKRDNVHYIIGSDGELMEVVDEEEDIELEQRQ